MPGANTWTTSLKDHSVPVLQVLSSGIKVMFLVSWQHDTHMLCMSFAVLAELALKLICSVPLFSNTPHLTVCVCGNTAVSIIVHVRDGCGLTACMPTESTACVCVFVWRRERECLCWLVRAFSCTCRTWPSYWRAALFWGSCQCSRVWWGAPGPGRHSRAMLMLQGWWCYTGLTPGNTRITTIPWKKSHLKMKISVHKSPCIYFKL